MRFSAFALLLLGACQPPIDAASRTSGPAPADTVLIASGVYTFDWPAPDGEGVPASGAPHDRAGWHPDATALAIRDGRIVHVGDEASARAHAGPSTRLLELSGATILPGFVDSHTHVVEMGLSLERAHLDGVNSSDEILDRLEAHASRLAPGEWLLADALDEGVWVHREFDGRVLDERFPDRPVFVRGLHGFAAWANGRALAAAGVKPGTPAPIGGEIRRDEAGAATGVLLNNAVDLLDEAVPAPSPAVLDRAVEAALREMARSGYVGVHEAGVDAAGLASFSRLESAGRLHTRVYAMLAASRPELLERWRMRGPDRAGSLQVRAVKAYYDGSLGARGARLLEDYSDAPGERGVSGANYGFDRESVARIMQAGFQVGVHAIGDAGNRETLAFFEDTFDRMPGTRDGRHRIEHAQVLHRDDFATMARLGLTASMEPPHAVEDKTWAEARLGKRRLGGAYAWRTMRRVAIPLLFNSDLPGSDHDLFYGLHAAITRQDRDGEPAGGWLPGERVTPEEAVRAYAVTPAWSSFEEDQAGVLAVGRRADLTVLGLDPLRVGERAPRGLLEGTVVLTMVNGVIVHDGRPRD